MRSPLFVPGPVVVLAVCALLASPAFASPFADAERLYGPAKANFAGTVVLKVPDGLHDDASVQRHLDAIAPAHGITLRLRRRGALNWHLVLLRVEGAPEGIPNEAETAAWVERLRKDPRILGASANTVRRAFTTPNDEYFSEMWNLTIIGMESAWDVSTGSSSQRIGVVDSGLVYGHPDLNDNDFGGFDFIDDTSTSVDGDGWDSDYTDEGTGCPDTGAPDSWHGTHVAGTIAAATNNNIGIAGVNWNAGVISARALGRCGLGAFFDILNATAWLGGVDVPGIVALSAANRPQIINLSLGGPQACATAEAEILEAVVANNVLVVAATGNEGAPVGSPANCSGAMAVAAYDKNAALAAYSNFGPEVEIVAPGGEIISAYDEGVLSTVDNGYDYSQGTSMATPHVAGVASLIWDTDPSLTVSEVREVLKSSGYTCDGCSNVPALVASESLALAASAMGGGGNTGGGNTGGGNTGGGAVAEVEPNDFVDSAQAVACGSTITGAISTIDDFDQYLLPSGSGDLSLSLSPDRADIDLYLTTGDDWENGDVVAGSQNLEAQAENISSSLTSAALYIVVAPYEVSTAVGYTLQVSCDAGGNNGGGNNGGGNTGGGNDDDDDDDDGGREAPETEETSSCSHVDTASSGPRSRAAAFVLVCGGVALLRRRRR